MDGIVVINKEQGYTSNDVVQIVKKLFHEKVGHTGTLDPMATGVLPLLVGKGTLCSKYLINHDKTYIAKVKLGIKTDTGDITGNVIEEQEALMESLNREKIVAALEKLKGKQLQTPPMYSAIKVNGKKLYEYARNGQSVEIEPREITIYDAKLIEIFNESNEIQFEVSCSKGTYIRTLCENFANLLGTIGTMSALERTKVGEFSIEDSVKIEEIKQNFDNEEFIENNFMDLEKFLSNLPHVILTPRSYISFINGVKLFSDEPNGIYRIYDINNKFIGTGKIDAGILKRDIVL